MATRLILPAVLALLAACSGDEEAPAPAAPAPAAEAPAPPAAPAAPAAGAHQADAADVLAPSPLAIQAEVKEAGLGVDLSTLVPKRSFKMDDSNLNLVAVRAGVLLADTILAGETMSKEDFVTHLKSLRLGMHTLGTGEGLLATIDEFIKSVENDGADRSDFVAELDGIAGMMIPGGGWGPDDKTGPLLQAGAWLEGTRIVATAVSQSGNAEAATKLLRRGEIADWFLGYVQDDGADKAAVSVVRTVSGALEELSQIGAQEQISVEDANKIAGTTDELFGML